VITLGRGPAPQRIRENLHKDHRVGPALALADAARAWGAVTVVSVTVDLAWASSATARYPPG